MSPSPAANPAIEVTGVTFAYHSQPVLTDVHFVIDPGDRVCMVGPNGGGKTTLVKLILGLLSPDQGTIRVFGQPPQRQQQRMGYVPQHSHFDPRFPISVLEVVCMGRLSGTTGHYGAEDRKAARQALDLVGLSPLADRPFSDLSGGQRQRVLIARALATGGDILILDEPTANIDKASEQGLFDLLAALGDGITIIMVTHEVGFASTFFQRMICVNNRVYVHPTSELTGELIQDIYGGPLQMIRHDHRCSERGHDHG